MGLGDLTEALSGLYPGLRIVDRELELAAGRVAQLVALDGLGELILVLAATDDQEGSLLTAMDAIAALETDRALIAEHCSAIGCDLRLPGRVVVISERFSERFLQRTRAAQDDALDLFEVRVMHSSSGRRVHLVPPKGLASQLERAQPRTAREFLEGLRRESRPLAQEFLERAQRIDEALAVDLHAGVLRLRVGEQTLAELANARGLLTARLGSAAPAAPPKVLAAAGDFEALLESVVAAYVEHRGPPQANGLGSQVQTGPVVTGAGIGSPPRAQGSSGPSRTLRDLDDADEARVMRGFDPASPILTPEEIEAFGRPM